MQWSWEVARLGRSTRSSGIAVRVHVTLILLLVLLALASGPDALWSLLFTAGVFAVVLLHELGHAIAARQLGIETRDILLLPIGGISRMDRAAETPWDEALIALAGPFVNLSLASLLAALFAVWPATWLYQGIMLNLVLGLFNLVPAFPMDGGRVLRAALWSRMRYLQATRLAARLGRALALGMIALGLLQSLPLALVGAFILASSSAEEQAVEMSTVLKDLRVADVCDARWVALHCGDTLAAAAAQMWAQRCALGLVLDEQVRGAVTAADLSAAVERAGPDAPLEAFMRRPVPTVATTARLGEIFQLFEGAGVLAVAEAGRVCAVLTPEHLAEALRLRRILDRPADLVPVHHGLPPGERSMHPPLCVSGGGGHPS